MDRSFFSFSSSCCHTLCTVHAYLHLQSSSYSRGSDNHVIFNSYKRFGPVALRQSGPEGNTIVAECGKV
jgi:hypothetical protein